MADMIWRKGEHEIDETVMQFTAGEDIKLDRKIFLFDIQASMAHVDGLADIEILSAEEQAALNKALLELADDFSAGRFKLDARFEDCHSAIESRLTERLGEVGKKVHTGRSRNDQVSVATRLYMLDSLKELSVKSREMAVICIERAENGKDIPMPGYTHMQRAVVSSVGMWFASFAEAFIDNRSLIEATRQWIDANPLGTAAGYGVNLPLARTAVGEALGFSRMQINPIYAQNSRGKFELQVLNACAQLLLDVRRLAWDLSLFSTAEFAFVQLPDRHTTGSSIMPNKRNPDLVELLRASYAIVQGAMAEMQSLLSLPSGYQRDLQFTKGPLIRGIDHTLMVMNILPQLINGMRFDEDAMQAAISPEMFATDLAVELAAQGVPFRDAYRQAMAESENLGQRTPEDSLKARVSPGGCANLCLDELRLRLDLRQGGESR